MLSVSFEAPRFELPWTEGNTITRSRLTTTNTFSPWPAHTPSDDPVRHTTSSFRTMRNTWGADDASASPSNEVVAESFVWHRDGP